MKRIMPLLAALLLVSICGIAQSNKSAEISIDQNMHDFGSVTYGSIARHDFKFYNSGKKPLTISDVKSGCVCATAEWPKEPIAGGQSGLISVTYDTKIVGLAVKKLTVLSNGETQAKDIAIKISVLKEVPTQVMPKDTLAPNPPGN